MCITSSADISGVRVARSLIFYLVLCRSCYFFSCFFWPLYFLYLFDLWILTTQFVSSNSCSTINNYRMCLLTFQTCIKRTLCNCNLNTYINMHGFLFRTEMFFRTIRELEYFFLSRKTRIFFPEFHIRLYDKISESDYFFFPPPKSEYFFQQHWESEYFYRKKK